MRYTWFKLFAPIFLRYALAGLFLWFGLNQLFRAEEWLVWLPQWVEALPLEPLAFIYLNGFLEVVLGTFLALGLFTRLSAVLLSLHLFGIAFSLGYNDIAVRDFCLALTTLAVALHGHDRWCYDVTLRKTWWGHTSAARALYLWEKDA